MVCPVLQLSVNKSFCHHRRTGFLHVSCSSTLSLRVGKLVLAFLRINHVKWEEFFALFFVPDDSVTVADPLVMIAPILLICPISLYMKISLTSFICIKECVLNCVLLH